MSELTFNIADYRFPARVRDHDRRPEVNLRSRFAVLSSNSEPRDSVHDWPDTQSVVVDIRSLREAHRTYPRRGKILRFSDHRNHRLYMMPAHNRPTSMDDDPGPMVA